MPSRCKNRRMPARGGSRRNPVERTAPRRTKIGSASTAHARPAMPTKVERTECRWGSINAMAEITRSCHPERIEGKAKGLGAGAEKKKHFTAEDAREHQKKAQRKGSPGVPRVYAVGNAFSALMKSRQGSASRSDLHILAAVRGHARDGRPGSSARGRCISDGLSIRAADRWRRDGSDAVGLVMDGLTAK